MKIRNYLIGQALAGVDSINVYKKSSPGDTKNRTHARWLVAFVDSVIKEAGIDPTEEIKLSTVVQQGR